MKSQPLPSDLGRVVRTLLNALATPLSAEIAQAVTDGRWDYIANLRVNPLAYSDPEVYFRDAQAVSLLRKCEDLPTTIDRKAVAVEKFWEAERQCKRTNDRLDIHLHECDLDRLAMDTPEGACARLIAEARKEMSGILGYCPENPKGRFGPGSTYGDRGHYTTVPDKISSQPTLTPGAIWYTVPWTGTSWAKASATLGRQFEFVRGNRFTTVSKDCTTDRGICIEPSINLFYQLGFGREMKHALRRSGINLKDGKTIHAQVAREASLTGSYSTLDLKNASDTVSKKLVKLLLPRRWHDALSALRSPTTFQGQREVLLEKFSSMGNGFTFELETAIFLAIILAVRNMVFERTPDVGEWPEPGRGIWVYGDDIIVPTFLVKEVSAALSYCGFVLNGEKSFIDGRFRESCGGDYFDGVDVRPYFLKAYPTEPQDWIAMANGLQAAMQGSRSTYLRKTWFAVLDQIPSHIRNCRGPESLGDLVIHDIEEKWSCRVRNGTNYVRCYRPARFKRIAWAHWYPEVQLAAVVYGAGDSRHGITPRDAVIGYKVGWVPLMTKANRWHEGLLHSS